MAKIKISIICDTKLWKEFRKKAIDEDISYSGLIEKLIKNYLKEGK